MSYPADPSKNSYPAQPNSSYAGSGFYGGSAMPPPPQNVYNPSYGGGAAPPPTYASSSAYPDRPGPQPQAIPMTRTVQPPLNDARHAEEGGPTSSNWVGSSFSDKAIRHRFIRKVYLILTTQLLVTVGIVCWFTFHKATKKWVQENWWCYLLAYALFIGLYIALACCRNVRRKYPANFICLGLFTLVFSYVAATIASYHDTEIVLIVLGITTVVVVAVSIFACQTKFDFTMCMGLLFGMFIVLFCFGLIVILIQYAISDSNIKILTCVYGALGALVFTFALIIDTQLIMGGKRYELEEEEYIYGALNLYVDIVYIFLFILMLFGGASN